VGGVSVDSWINLQRARLSDVQGKAFIMVDLFAKEIPIIEVQIICPYGMEHWLHAGGDDEEGEVFGKQALWI
jgi:hypothetical protein